MRQWLNLLDNFLWLSNWHLEIQKELVQPLLDVGHLLLREKHPALDAPVSFRDETPQQTRVQTPATNSSKEVNPSSSSTLNPSRAQWAVTDQGTDPSHELLQLGGEDEDCSTNQKQVHPHLEGGEPDLLLHVGPETSPVGCKCVKYPKVAVQLLGGHTWP